MRKFLKALPILAALLFGLKEIGSDPIAPGPDLNFSWDDRAHHGLNCLSLQVDRGDLNCFLQMTIRSKDPGILFAELSDGTPLRIQSVALQKGTVWQVTISGLSPAPPLHQAKFLWPAGLKLLIASRNSPINSTMVEDWRIYLDKDRYDSKAKQMRRNGWTVFSILLLLVLGASAFMKEDPQTLEKAFTAEVCVARLIDGIEASSPDESQRLRKFLQDVVLEGAGVREGLEATGLAIGAQRVFLFKARRAFQDRLKYVIERLTFFYERFS